MPEEITPPKGAPAGTTKPPVVAIGTPAEVKRICGKYYQSAELPTYKLALPNIQTIYEDSQGKVKKHVRFLPA
ncbi:hypothetical protein ILUMI_22954 [Ignelater luminosus]|uniref:Uncharacterized protein n=1 Tax=Ignelater luminosus TaxID=2038154 RepID=A0A8K0G023_IGNLU|nr:hypothetical protein ILUMI_22954 [Ignelater luminosus]